VFMPTSMTIAMLLRNTVRAAELSMARTAALAGSR
jgi:hypothetical protein